MHLQQLINDLAQDLGASLLVEDRQHRVVAFSPQRSDIDEVRRDTILTRHARAEVQTWLHDIGIHEARTPVRVPRNEALNMLSRVCVPVWQRTVPLGYLWILDSELQSQGSLRHEMQDLSDKIAAAWHSLPGEASPVESSRPRVDRGSLALQLWTGTASAAESALAQWQAAQHTTDRDKYVPVVVRAVAVQGATTVQGATAVLDESSLSDMLRDAVPQAVLEQALWTIRDGEALLVLPADDTLCARLEAQLSQTCQALTAAGTVTVRAGIGPVAAQALELQESISRATSCIDIAEAYGFYDSVSAWETLGLHRAAFELAMLGMRPQDLVARFDALLTIDHDGVLLETLERYLEAGGSARDAAAALHIHRTSLYYRLDRVSTALECDLAQGTQRLSLFLALLLHRLTVAP